ncbi:serine/threonine-protein kinase ATG1a-like [Aristolochia californica]|uniref:serine/threonine-protein kinase ATG1a-like n=1 Tax=Aristolochia californica TaxID=171875 RepID=UPI0035DA0BD2
MDDGPSRCRLVGDYILGPKIGSGSFAVVWRSRHRSLGVEVAVKEIDKKQLSSKVNESLLNEINILRQIKHPNIIRLHDAIQTEDKIYLVLEYCVGGDLGAYIQRFGRVSDTTAKHFMRQLATGLQVLQENHLIHRDLKPQNLLLSSTLENAVLKIGDFGFARYLTPQCLADTLCGSPLYMAPEIIQNQKYDAKADLWSVGAILFELVMGKPPFDGNNQFQLFQNILTSTELKFTQGIMEELNPDCVDLCRKLLRQNPVERLTFEEFFNHKFMAESRLLPSLELSSSLTEQKSLLEQELPLAAGRNADGEASVSSDPASLSTRNENQDPLSISRSKVVDSLDAIEQEYVLVNAHSALLETVSSSLELSKGCPVKNCEGLFISPQPTDTAISSSCDVENFRRFGSASLHESCASTEGVEVQDQSPFHPSLRLQLLHHYLQALADLAQEKFNAGLLLESFSVELVTLAVWKEALRVSHSWLNCNAVGDSPGSSSGNDSAADKEGASSLVNFVEAVDFNKPTSVRSWAEQGFLGAFDQAEKISNYLWDMDGKAQMPTAMDIIFQAALAAGRSGAVDELMGNRICAAASYSKATVLLSFILQATSLPLNPPFSLTVASQQRLEKYIANLRVHQSRSEIQHISHQSRGLPNK